MNEPLTEVVERLSRIEVMLESLLREKTVKDWYSTAEVAVLVGKAEYTVREWCRLDRVHATKKLHARGAHMCRTKLWSHSLPNSCCRNRAAGPGRFPNSRELWRPRTR